MPFDAKTILSERWRINRARRGIGRIGDVTALTSQDTFAPSLVVASLAVSISEARP